MAVHLAGKHTTRTAGKPLGELATQSTTYSKDWKSTAQNIYILLHKKSNNVR